jgi:hypothetical protein
MRTNYVRYIITSLMMVLGDATLAQVIIPNGDFEINCGGDNTNNGCPTFSMNCVLGWHISHGSPNLRTTGGIIGLSRIGMWSRSGEGEGVYADLNHPTPIGKPFELCFYYQVSTSSSGLGNIVVKLTSGLTPLLAVAACSGYPLNLNPNYIAYDSPAISGGWQLVSIAIPPLSQSFTQLNVYPNTMSHQTFAVHVDGFQLNYCNSELLITPMTMPNPVGLYDNKGYITSTSSGSSGIVSVMPNQTTTFRAQRAILLQPNFVADPNQGSFFLAEIDPCVCDPRSQSSAEKNIISETSEQFLDQDQLLYNPALQAQIEVFPNPTSGNATVQSSYALEKVELISIPGKVLRSWPCPENTFSLDIDLDAISTGVYLVRIRTTDGRILTKKLIKE